MEGDTADNVSSRSDLVEVILKQMRTTKAASVKSCSDDDDEIVDTNDAVGDAKSDLSASLGDLRVTKRHSVTLEDPSDDINFSSGLIELPKWKHGLDHTAWCEKKKQELKKKKKKGPTRQELEEKETKEQKEMEKAARKKAWEHWVAQKKNQHLQQQIAEIKSQKMKQELEEQRSEISRRKFTEWVHRKEEERLDKQITSMTERIFREQATDRKKKLNYNIKWDEWYQKKRHLAVPKFTHVEYPAPAWINPKPWVE